MGQKPTRLKCRLSIPAVPRQVIMKNPPAAADDGKGIAVGSRSVLAGLTTVESPLRYSRSSMKVFKQQCLLLDVECPVSSFIS